MLSENLAALRAHFLKYQASGVVLTPRAIDRIADLMLDMTLDASALECSRISPVAAAVSLPDNVVVLPTGRRS